jgi:hypothetical protein
MPCIPPWKVASVLAVDTNMLVFAAMRTRNFIPPAATGSSANGRDRILGTPLARSYLGRRSPSP